MIFTVWDDGDWDDEDERLWDADYDLTQNDDKK